MNRSTIRHAASLLRTEFAEGFANDLRPTAQVLPLVRSEGRRPRRETSPSEPLGQILLFTGVRYERMPDADPAAAQRWRS